MASSVRSGLCFSFELKISSSRPVGTICLLKSMVTSHDKLRQERPVLLVRIEDLFLTSRRDDLFLEEFGHKP
jgi:hypothetical protein